jgi:hypothetical protein
MNEKKQSEIMEKINEQNHQSNLGYLLNHEGYFNYRLEKYGDSKEKVIEELKNDEDWDTIDFLSHFLRKYGIEKYKKTFELLMN